MPDLPSPEVLKRMRLDAEGTAAPAPAPPPAANGGNGMQRATVQDVSEDDGGADDGSEAFAPGGDADYFVEEDAEGRFFGGGLTAEQKSILELFEKAQGEGVQDEGVRRSTPSARCVCG